MDIEERLHKFLSCTPRVDPSAYIAEGAIVIGAVTIGPHASVWHNCVLRGDIERIRVGEGSNIQDGAVIHLADDIGVSIGKYVTVGHLAMVHACTIEDECLIGMKATILDGAVIGRRSIVGAGAVVTKNTVIPPGSLVLGTPAKVVKALSEAEQSGLREWADKYVKVAAFHKRHFSLLA